MKKKISPSHAWGEEGKVVCALPNEERPYAKEKKIFR